MRLVEIAAGAVTALSESTKPASGGRAGGPGEEPTAGARREVRQEAARIDAESAERQVAEAGEEAATAAEPEGGSAPDSGAETWKQAAELEEAIRRIRGVLGCRVVTGPAGLEEIHVVASSSRSAKQVVRDIESVSATRFGLSIDHRKVSVALVDEPVPRQPPKGRAKLRRVRLEVEPPRVRVTVELEGADGSTYQGSAEGAGPASEAPLAAARATLQAMEAYLGERVQLRLRELVPFHLGNSEGFMAGVTWSGARGEEELLGTALIRLDRVDAAVRATLDALNRRTGRPLVEGV